MKSRRRQGAARWYFGGDGAAFGVADSSAVWPIAILLGTIILIAWRPGWLREGVVASLGAGLMILGGWATLDDVGQTVTATGGIICFLLSMMVVAAVADRAGFFDWAAHRAICLSGGRGRVLYVVLYLLGAIITLFLSLDVTAIVFTPIVCALAVRLRVNPVPFVFASAFVANTASLMLPVSNLTNMLVCDLLGMDFWRFVGHMALPQILALAVNLGIFLVIFRRDIPTRFERGASSRQTHDGAFLRAAQIGLAVVIVGLLLAGFVGWPLYAVALAGCVGFVALGLLSGNVTVPQLARGVAWQLPFFVVGMYMVVLGVNRASLGPLWSDLVSLGVTPPGVVLLAFVTALGSNLVNNIPMSLVSITALHGTAGAHDVPAFATVLGTNLGPNVTIFGSLATMLVLSAARQRGVDISAGRYLKIGLVTTPPMIVVATIGLLVTSRW